jgi:hypothetical protein
MRVFSGSFKKKDGTERAMKFVLLDDVDAEVKSKLFKSDKPGPKLPEGSVRVWDIEARGVRIYNSNTATTDLTVTEEPVVFIYDVQE